MIITKVVKSDLKLINFVFLSKIEVWTWYEVNLESFFSDESSFHLTSSIWHVVISYNGYSHYNVQEHVTVTITVLINKYLTLQVTKPNYVRFIIYVNELSTSYVWYVILKPDDWQIKIFALTEVSYLKFTQKRLLELRQWMMMIWTLMK